MPDMPSAEMRTVTTATMNPTVPMKGPEFNISSKDVEGLVLEIKQNLRLSAATTMKAIPCSHLSRKSSRASPYRIPGKFCCDSSSCEASCFRKNRRKAQQDVTQEDPYELLQKLLRDGSLVNEAVRRVKLGLTPKQSTLSMGPGTHNISTELYMVNRNRLIERLRADSEDGVVLLQGGDEIPFYDTDTSYVFRQESYFNWCFGVTEPGCYGAIDIRSGDAYLFVPRLPESYTVWMGPLKTLEEYHRKYDIPHVHYTEELYDVLKRLKRGMLLTLKGRNSDSGHIAKEAMFEGIGRFCLDQYTLFPAIAELRVYKTKLELAVLKYVIEVSSAAHRKVMRYVKPGKTEYQCESEFLNYCYSVGGCRHVSYTCICGSGTNSSILHYGHAAAPNSAVLKDGDLCLFDMGANYFGYAADITCTFPVNGKFTPEQKFIYEAVLSANNAVQLEAKPGVSWTAMHLLANRILLEKLTEGGLLVGDVDDMMDAGLAATFQPHGLGHLLGLDVHDVGGYLEGHPPRAEQIGLRNLRTARILTENMVMTIEPGCYFIDTLIDRAIGDRNLNKFLNCEELKKYRGFGGVRIEDDVVITKDGVLNLTKVPRTVQEIEDWMAGEDDAKYSN